MNQNNSERDSERYRMDKVRDEEIILFPTRNKMREYKITKCDLWYNIYKIYKWCQPWYLSPWKKRVLKQEYAKIYFHREEAVSDLIISKRKDEKSD